MTMTIVLCIYITLIGCFQELLRTIYSMNSRNSIVKGTNFRFQDRASLIAQTLQLPVGDAKGEPSTYYSGELRLLFLYFISSS